MLHITISRGAWKETRLPGRADIVAKRFLVLERRTVFSHLDRIGNFDSQSRPFGSYYCRISLAGPLLGDFCNNIGQIRTHAPQQNASKSDRTILRNKAAQRALDALRSLALSRHIIPSSVSEGRTSQTA